MLLELAIRDFAIIEDLRIAFCPGLNIFTGETGAGKSIIMDALSLILGDRASVELIRSGAEEAQVEAAFDVKGRGMIAEALKQAGMAVSDELIVKRVVQRNGRNKVYINGSLAPLSTLAGVGRSLIDICSQGEHETLKSTETHVELLDSSGDYQGLKREAAEAYGHYAGLRKRLDALLLGKGNLDEKRDMLCFRLKEIEDAGLKPGEDIELKREKEILRNSERLKSASCMAEETLYSGAGSITERLGEALKTLKDVAAFDDALGEVIPAIEGSLFSLEDAAMFLRAYADKKEHDPERLDFIEERLELISRLKKKHGETVDLIIKKGVEIEAELAGIEHMDEDIKAVEKDLQLARAAAEDMAKRLSSERAKAAKALKRNIEKELDGLGIKAAKFEARVEKDADNEGNMRLSENGADRVAFLISTNPGEPLLPLERVASGGELSRIMLAMKGLIAGGGVETLVFDEIDAGVGGSVAQVVGLKLKETSLKNQVICITHLPQIAAFADRHFCVLKRTTRQGRTVTDVTELRGEGRIEHLCLMLGGMKVTDAIRKGATELVESARDLSLKATRH